MNLQQLRTAFEEWNGEPHYVLTFAAPDEQAIPENLEIWYYFGEEVEEYPTAIATIGLAIYNPISTSERAELMFYIAIGQSQQDYERVGKGLANLVWSCLAKGSYFIPNQVMRGISIPLFERMNCLFVIDWGYTFPEWLPGIEPEVRLLEIVPIYESEAEQLDNIEKTLREKVFKLATKKENRSNPRRDRVCLLTEATKVIWERFERWCRSNAPLVCRDIKSGATAEEIKILEQKIGLTLPEDFAAYLMVHNGTIWFASYEYIGTEQIYQIWLMMNRIKEEGFFSNRQIDRRSQGIIKNTWWDWHWIPFAEDSCGNLLCIDLEPEVNGSRGQVIYWEKIEGPLPSGCQLFFVWFRDMQEGLGRYYVVNEDGRIEKKI
jgi:cell wall assembly regulator SMI1